MALGKDGHLPLNHGPEEGTEVLEGLNLNLTSVATCDMHKKLIFLFPVPITVLLKCIKFP